MKISIKNSILILLFVLFQIKILGQIPRSEVNCPTPEITFEDFTFYE